MGAIVSPIAVEDFVPDHDRLDHDLISLFEHDLSENRFPLFRIMLYIAADRAEAQRV
jgi:hypothetical protein